MLLATCQYLNTEFESVDVIKRTHYKHGFRLTDLALSQNTCARTTMDLRMQNFVQGLIPPSESEPLPSEVLKFARVTMRSSVI